MGRLVSAIVFWLTRLLKVTPDLLAFSTAVNGRCAFWCYAQQ